jgi:hypothetical protein
MNPGVHYGEEEAAHGQRRHTATLCGHPSLGRVQNP